MIGRKIHSIKKLEKNDIILYKYFLLMCEMKFFFTSALLSIKYASFIYGFSEESLVAAVAACTCAFIGNFNLFSADYC
jgi:hypothetical protein